MKDNEKWFETSGKTFMSRGSVTSAIHWKGWVFRLLCGGWIAGCLYYAAAFSNSGKDAEGTFLGFLAFIGVLIYFMTMAARSRQENKTRK